MPQVGTGSYTGAWIKGIDTEGILVVALTTNNLHLPSDLNYGAKNIHGINLYSKNNLKSTRPGAR